MSKKTKNLKWIERFILWGIIGYLLFNKYQDYRFHKKYEVHTEIDTVVVEKEIPIEIMIPVGHKECIVVTDTAVKELVRNIYPAADVIEKKRLFKEPDLVVPVNTYSDTIEVDGASLSYRHHVYGTLLDSKYSIKYPEQTITKESVVERKHSTYLTLGTEFGAFNTPQIEIGLAYQRQRFIFSYTYDFTLKSHNIGVGYRLK